MMMFFNIVRCDIKNGILKRWKTYLFTGILFSLLAVFASLDFDAALRMNPSPVTSTVTLGDYLCFLCGGTSAGNAPIQIMETNNIVNSMFKFSFPSIWILMYLILLLITLQYPYEDLMGFGKIIMILSNKIHYWWLSKCVWVTVSAVLYFVVAVVCFSLTSILLGAEMSFEIGTYYPYFRFSSPDFLKNPPWNILPTLSMLIPVGIGLCMIQLVTSMITSRLTSYLISTAFLLASAYMQNVLLFPNVSMFARSIEVVTNGQVAWVELIIIAWISVVCMLTGYLYLKKSDIINKHR